MTYSHEVEHMCVVKKGPNHGPAPIPKKESGKIKRNQRHLWPDTRYWLCCSAGCL